MQEGNPAAISVGKVVLATITSKVLGFLRETLIAAVFGASRLTDAYLVAATLPGMLFSGFQNALQTSVVPVFTEVLAGGGKKEAFAMLNSLINLVLVISLVFISLGMLAVPWVVQILAPGFEPEIQELAVKLARIMFPLVVFWVLTGIIGGVLNTFSSFAVPAMVGIPYNLVIIFAIFTLGNYYGIYGLAWGTLLAVASQVLFQFPGCLALGYRYRFILNLRDPGVIKIARLSVPVLLSAIFSQASVVVDRVLASGLEAGSIAALSFADRVNALALGLVAGSIATVMFPALSRDIAQAQVEEFKSKVLTGLTIVCYIGLPLAVFMVALAEPIVQVIFQRGAFGSRDTELTAIALRYYALGTLAVAIRIYLEKVYYSLKDSLTPMVLGAVTVILYIVLSINLVPYLALGGLALGISLAQCIYVAAAFRILNRRELLHTGLLFRSGVKIISGALAMAVLLYLGSLWLKPVFTGNFTGQLAYIATCGGAGGLCYFFITLSLKTPESIRVWSLIKSKKARSL